MDITSHDHEPALADLISLWQRRRADGETVTAVELCRDRPELLPALERQIAALQQLDALAKDVHETATILPQSGEHSNGATPADPCATLATSSQEASVPLAEPVEVPAVPGYEVLGVLGRGGMGVVYRARQRRLSRVVALKMILHAEHAGDQERQRFQAEAEAVARLQHPNIVHIYEVGEHRGLPFFSLEFCGGGSLEAKLGGTPLPPMEAAKLVQILAGAMQVAHDKGILHRDLKPANVLLLDDGTPKITDFGLAKKLGEQGQTQTGAVMGTPSYMAPEQAGGKSKEIGPAADIYALGAILYELLTGRPPFKAATTLDTVLLVISEEPVPPRRLQPKTPRDLETICLKCLQKEPSRRYASAADLAEDLRCFQNELPIAARPIGRIERGWRWCRRNPALALAAAAVVSILVAGSIVSTYFGIEAQQSAEIAQQRELDAREGERKAQQALADLKSERGQSADYRYATYINRAYNEWQAHNNAGARKLLEQCPGELRGWEWDFLKSIFDEVSLPLRGHSGSVLGIALTPDGNRACTFGSDSTIRVWDARSGVELRTIRQSTRRFALSPDGRSLAVAAADARAVVIYEIASGREVARFNLSEVACGLGYVRGGKELIVVTLDGKLTMHDPLTGAIRSKAAHKLSLDSQSAAYWRLGQGVVVSPDGAWLAQGGGDTKVRVWNAVSGEKVMEGAGHLKLVGQVAFRPDSKQLASPGGEGEIHIWDLETKKLVRVLRGHRNWVWSVAYSGDGKQLISAAKDATARLWDVESGKELMTLHGHDAEVWAVAFAGNGSRAATASPDGTGRVWELANRVFNSEVVERLLRKNQANHVGPSGGMEYLTFFSHGCIQGATALSPDGRYMVATPLTEEDLPNHITIWDLDARRIARQIKVAGALTVVPTFTHDGRGLIAGSAILTPQRQANVRRYSFPEGKQVWEWTGPQAAFVIPALSPDSRTLMVLLRVNVAGIISLAPNSPDLLVALDAETGSERYRQTLGAGYLGPAFTADGREVLIADGSAGQVKVLDPATGNVLRQWQAGTLNLTALACSSGDVAATADAFGAITLWDIHDGHELRRLEGHVGLLMGLAFSPDGKRLLSCAGDSTARVWNVESGRELLNFRDHTDVPLSVAWSKDGSRLATACQDGAVRVWQGPAAAGAAQEDWPVLVRDDFQRQELGRRWKQALGRWEVQDGTLRGHQEQFKSEGLNFPIAEATLQEVDMPNHFELRFRYQSPKPLAMGVVLRSPDGGSSLLLQPILAGKCGMTGSPTALLQLITQVSSSSVKDMKFATIGLPRHFDAEPGRWHDVRLLREPERLRVWMDGKPVVHERIPDVELPSLSLGGSWGEVGDIIEIADVVIRAPVAAVRTSALRARVRKKFAQLKLRDEVRRYIEADSKLSTEERSQLPRLIDALVEDEADLEITSCATVWKPGKTLAEYALALRQAEAAVRLGPTNDHLRTLGLAQLRCGKFADAVQTLKKSILLSREMLGSALPSHYAALAMAYHGLGQPKEARAAYQQLITLRHSDHWGNDRGRVDEMLEETRSVLGPEATVDPEVDQLTQRITRAEQDGWLKHRVDSYLALYTDDATLTAGRFEKPDRHDVVLNRRQLEAVRRMQFRGPSLPENTLVFSWEDVRAEIKGNAAEWRCRWAAQTENFRSYESFESVYQLIRTADGWRVCSQRVWPVAQKKGGQLTVFTPTWYGERDRAADALSDKEALAKIDALREAHRYADAYRLARAATQRWWASWDLWDRRGDLAFTLGDVADVLASFRKAEERNPEIKLPPYLSRLRQVFEGHGEQGVGAVMYIPSEGKRLFSDGFDGFGRIWAGGSGQEFQHFEVRGEALAGGAVSRDGKRVAAGSNNIHVWDVDTSKLLWVGKGHTKIVYRLHFRGDGQRLVSASADGTARVWDAATGKELLAFTQHNQQVLGAEFSPDGRHVVSCGGDNLARLWDAESGEQIRVFSGHTAGLKRAVFSPDGHLLATASEDQTVRIWDVATGKELRKLLGHNSVVDVAAFSPDGKLLASGDWNGTIRLWDVATGKLRYRLSDYPGEIYSLAFRPDGQELAAAGTGRIRLYAVGPLR